MSVWTLARRCGRMNPSVLREILKVAERPGIKSMAGGLPSPLTFPVEAIKEACQKVLTDAPGPALQYAASEGFGPLREWVAARLSRPGYTVSPDEVLVTTGSQQGLELMAKAFIDPGAPIAVEQPTYLGALQAFTPFEPEFVAVDCDDEGPLPQALQAAAGARFLYVLPNFQNPSGRSMGLARRVAVAQAAARARLPLVEDNPYGELWYDAPPPTPLAAVAAAEGAAAIYLGSFSKVLAPGLRLGYVVAPAELYPKLLQAKQAADLHTPGFNQRVAYEVIRAGLLDKHLPMVRAMYKTQRDAMRDALHKHLPDGCRFNVPAGGMFFWVELPAGLDTRTLLPRAVDAGMAYVPGAPFYCRDARANTLRLSFVTVAPPEIDKGVAALGRVLAEALQQQR